MGLLLLTAGQLKDCDQRQWSIRPPEAVRRVNPDTLLPIALYKGQSLDPSSSNSSISSFFS